MANRKILVLNGPNLDMLGVREPDIYGKNTLGNLEYELQRYGEERGVEVECYQSNSEGKLIGKIHKAPGAFDGIVYNPGAHTHYSYALRDAVASIDVPVVEVHLSDVDAREPFRSISVIAPACVAQVKGLGFDSYRRGIDILCRGGALPRLGEDYREKAIGGKPYEPEPEPEEAPAPEPEPALTLEFEPMPVPMSESEPAPEVVEEVAPANELGQLSRARQDAVARACARLGIVGLTVRDTANIQWISAFDGVFDEERAHALLVVAGLAILHTDSRYANALEAEGRRIGSNVKVAKDPMRHEQFMAEVLAQDGAPAGKIGIEDSITYAEFVKMVEHLGAERLAPTSDVVLNLRAVKDAGEIARLKAAQAITDAAFAHITRFMRPGMTEREVQLELESFMLRNGADGLAFRSIVAAGANGADPHAIPGEARLEAGQCVVMDFGAKRAGYCSDMTRTVFLGQPDGEMARAWETLRRANETVEAALRPGLTGADAHKLAEGVLAEGGFGGKMGHGLGHGVGLEVHELPVLNTRNEAPLAAGNVVTVEPGIYLPGQFGMRLEDFGVVTETGYDVFTKSTHEMVVL